MTVAVLIPARDEAPRLGAVLRALGGTLPDIPVLVVDDGSQDATGPVAEELGAQVLRTPGLGYGGALRTGYRALLDEGVQRVVQLDADGQHPPQAAPELLHALTHADWIIGSRAGTGSPGPLGRRLGNRLLCAALHHATGVHLTDATSGYWASGPRAIELFAEILPDGAVDAWLRARALREGLSIHEVPVHMYAREQGASMHTGLRAVRHLAHSLRGVLAEGRG